MNKPRSSLPLHHRACRTSSRTAVLLAAIGWPLALFLGTAEASAAAQAGSHVFENVTVVPMEGAVQSLPGRTVVVTAGRIVAVGERGSVAVPSGSTRIDGTGRFLIPGLADMRVKLPGANDASRDLLEDDFLFRHVARGITTLRTVEGASYQPSVRDAVARGEILGPTLYVGSPSLVPLREGADGNQAAAVNAYAQQGFDFITIDGGLSVAGWNRAVEAANARGISFAGRQPAGVSVEEALDAGISTLDRLDGFLEATRTAGLPANAPRDQVFRATDMQKLRALARRTAEAGVFVIPAQFLANHLQGWNHLVGHVDSDSTVHLLPEYRYVTQRQGQEWLAQVYDVTFSSGRSAEYGRAYAEWRTQLVRVLHEEGVPILMGSESPGLLNVPAFSLFREMELLEQAGLTPFEILETGTRNVARYVGEVLGKPANFGSVVPGNRADLVLLEEDPLQSISALSTVAGVMVGGRWVPKSEIDPQMRRLFVFYTPEVPD